MSEDRFWSLVDGVRALTVEEQVPALRRRLATLSPEELVAYEKCFTQLSNGLVTWDHYGAAEVILGFTSDDVFTDFRTWVVFRGRDVYTAFRADPDSLADHGPTDEEELGLAEDLEFLADDLYEERTGESMIDREDYPMYSDPVGDPPDDSNASLARRYPRLAARYLSGADPDGSPGDGPRPVS